MRFSLKRFGAVGASVTMAGALLAVGASVATAPSAFADTTQTNACLGVTGTFSDFAVPITGTALPNPVVSPNAVTLSNVSVAIQVSSTLIGAGVTTGLVSASSDLAHLGVTDNTGAANVNGGINAVVAAVGSVHLKVTGSNTVEGTQTASNPAIASTTFYVTADASGGTVVVYSAVTNPPVLGGPNAVDLTRTGTVLVGNLTVTIPLSNTTWTPTGATPINFTEAQVTPSTTTAASITAADKAAAPLQILPKINGAISVPFYCWVGTSDPAAGAFYTPVSPSQVIASVVVQAPPTAPICATPQSASVGGAQAVTVTPNCTNNNPPFVASSANIMLNGANGGAVNGTVAVQANGGLLYTNSGNGQNTDTFAYHATNVNGSSNNVTVNIQVLNNACTTGADSDTGNRVNASGTAVPGPDGPEPENPKGASDNPCNLKQVLIVPVAPSTLAMSQAGNQDILGATANLATQSCGAPIPLTLNGGPQYACGALSEVTVVNARGTDDGWTLTGQVTDFIDGTRGPGDHCSPGPNITATPAPDNHCIPGGNLGWIPASSIVDPAIPGDTAAIISGNQILPPIPGVNVPASTARPVAPLPGLHDAAQVLCYSQDNQSGGTFHCDAGLILGVPGSAAAALAPGYEATLTLTLG